MPAKKKQDGEPRRVVFYIRWSSWKQDGENSREGQHNALQAYADATGGICVGIYTDEGISGRRDDRPDLNRLMRDARSRNRPFDEVLIWKFDRLGRKASSIDRRATELEELGIAVTAVQQPIEGKPSVVRFVRTLLAGVSEFFSDNMGEDIARGRKTSASHGVWTNSSIPFGFVREYRSDRGRMRPFLVPDPKTADIIRRVVQLYLDGTGVRKITKVFQEENVPGPNDNPWNPARVTNFLKNIAYAGFIQFGKRSKFEEMELLVPVPEMEIITLEEYNRVQEIMASHAPNMRHPREVASHHSLSGLVYSDGCGSKMSPTGGERSYYNCNRRRNQTCPSCETPNPRADHLDAAVIDHVFGKILTPENMDQVIDIVAKGETVTTEEVEEELTDLQLEIEGQKNARKKLLKLVEDEDAVPGDTSERLTEIRETIAKLEANTLKARAKISNERSLTANPKKVAAYAKSLQTYLRKENIELTKEILREVIVQVRIRPGEEKDTTTVIIRYRIPMPPREWKESADVEELLLRKNQRSLEYPVLTGRRGSRCSAVLSSRFSSMSSVNSS
jgi:site-specific DNA recombinase